MNHSKKQCLIIGYGNPDRGDDGVAWFIVHAMAKKLHFPVSVNYFDGVDHANGEVTLLTVLQLTPELCDLIAEHERVCFIDAHSGAVPEAVHVEELQACFQNSPLTHHMTPQTCLCITKEVFGVETPATLLSVRGHQFNFENALTPDTEVLAEEAINWLADWMQVRD